MVGKLLKHELYRIARIAAIPAVAMIALAILCRISLIGAADSPELPAIIMIFYIIAIVATLVVCAWVGIVRFYRTLFTGEGYMTLSLPVSADQLLISKLLSSIIASLGGVVVCVLSALILLIGQGINITMILDSLSSVLIDFGVEIVNAGGGLYVFELVLLYILSIPMSFLLFYLVMAVAQLFTTKNRTVIAVALYFGGAFVWSIIMSLVGNLIIYHALQVSVHLYMWIEIVFTIAVDLISYFVVRYIIKNKVNLLT